MKTINKTGEKTNEKISGADFCGALALYEGDVEYTLSENLKYYIASIKDKETTGDVVIPAYYRDLGETDYLPVLAFHNGNGRGPISLELSPLVEELKLADIYPYFVSEVRIPDSTRLKKIGDYAFAQCYDIKNFYIPKTVEVMGGGVFAYWGENPKKPQTVHVPYAKNAISSGWSEYWDGNSDIFVYAEA